jgi:hypothetical protein
MNSMAFLLLSKSNSKTGGNQITFGTVDFQPHEPTLASAFVSLDQEMDLTIGSFNFHVGSLGSIPLLDPVKSGPSAGRIAIATTLEASVGSSSEVNSSVSIKPTRRSTIKELNKLMENLDLEESSDYQDMSSNRNSNIYYKEDFMICYDNISNDSENTWKSGLELYDDEQLIFSSGSTRDIHSQHQVYAIIDDTSKEFNDNNNPIIKPTNVRRGANHIEEGDTAESIMSRRKVQLTVEEWDAINNGAAILVDARR